MTPSENAAAEAAALQAENTAARHFAGNDNPNPELGRPTPTPDAPAGNDNQEPAAPQLSKREQIAQAAQARRKAAEEAEGVVEQNEMGEYIPPFVARQEAEATAAREAEEKATADKKAASDTETFTLKVRGRDIPVTSRAELAQLAEIEEDEANDYTPAQLIKLAQKQIAANEILDEAKQAKKSARTVAREADDTLSDPDTTDQDQDLSREPAPQPDPNQDRAAKYRQTIEKIQFGDPEEAAAAFTSAIAEGVKETIAEQQYGRRVQNVQSIIEKAGTEFEAANADLMQDRDFAEMVYSRGFVSELKRDLIAQGLAPENVERVVGNDVRSAMHAYVTIAADGRVRVRPPHQMFAAAAQTVRAKVNRPAPTPTTSTTTTARTASQPPALQRRVDAKRALTPQPNRASVPRQTTAPMAGQTPAARSNVVHQMRKQRGQAA